MFRLPCVVVLVLLFGCPAEGRPTARMDAGLREAGTVVPREDGGGTTAVDARGPTDSSRPEDAAACPDADADGVCDDVDVCPGADDTLDRDSDLVPDACDVCDGFADSEDADGDKTPDGCDACAGFDDDLDEDTDRVPDGCDCDQNAGVCDAHATCLTGSVGVVCICDEGYGGDGRFCAIAGCAPLSPPFNGSVDMPSSSTGARATYACGSIFTLVGDPSRLCQEDGLWSGTEPTCIPNCAAPLSPANGDVGVTPGMDGFAAAYSCSSGYEILGGGRRLCGSDHEWIGSEPVCSERLDCSCSGAFLAGERVSAAVADPLDAIALPVGTPGTVIAATMFFGESYLLVEFDDWYAGHDGNCYNAACGVCSPSGTSRWWLLCSHVTSERLRCACGGSFAQGDRVVALTDEPSSATALPAETVGTVMAARSAASGDQLLVEWDGWVEGHDGACYLAACGECAPLGKSRWWVDCDLLRSAQ